MLAPAVSVSVDLEWPEYLEVACFEAQIVAKVPVFVALAGEACVTGYECVLCSYFREN